MKKILLIVLSMLAGESICFSQILNDYPFKTFLDRENFLYVVGNNFNTVTNTRDIFITKYSDSGEVFSNYFPSFYGDDNAIDLAVDDAGNVAITGYVFNSLTQSNDIITLKYRSDGTLQWDTVIASPGNDKGMAIDLTTDEITGDINAIYLAGFKSTASDGKDFFTMKLDLFGSDSWQATYNNPIYNSDDVATEILLDEWRAYVVGYTYQGPLNKNDIMILSYDKLTGTLEDSLIHTIAKSDEKPTSFIITDFARSYIEKSRSVVTSITDHINTPGVSKFLTLYCDEDMNHNLNIRWSREFINPKSQVNVVTSSADDTSDHIIVAGYSNNDYSPSTRNKRITNGLDFTVIKYNKTDGSYMWNPPARFHNVRGNLNSGLDDRASSVKVNQFNEIFAAGPSDGSTNGYSIFKIVQNNPPFHQWSEEFIPNFITEHQTAVPQLSNKWATVHLSGDGSPLVVAMAWNNEHAYWSAYRYNRDGQLLYVINNGSTDNNNTAVERDVVLTNYPNPFNPSTVIHYSVRENIEASFVQIKVYDMLGREVIKLVNEYKPAGNYNIVFQGSNLPSGTYFCKMFVNGISRESRMLLLLK